MDDATRTIAIALETWDRKRASSFAEPQAAYVRTAEHVTQALKAAGYELKATAAA